MKACPSTPAKKNVHQTMISEFSLITRFFDRPVLTGRAPVLGIGDDCALLAPAAGKQLAVSSDMLVEGRHFFAGADAFMLGHKALAVNLSDLAAMGATPLGFTLALALPGADEAWLAPFSDGLLQLAAEHGCPLVGGDTTKGPLTISITIFGEIEPGRALRRDAGRAGDDIWISGTLGDARLALAGYWHETLAEYPQGLQLSQTDQQQSGQRMHAPAPRNALGMALSGQGLAFAAIDISDGLSGDLGHLMKRSGLGALIDVDALPCGPVLARQPLSLRRRFTLSGGDDYELCFTAPVSARAAILEAGRQSDTAVTRVGSMEAGSTLRLIDASGAPLTMTSDSFDHFTSA